MKDAIRKSSLTIVVIALFLLFLALMAASGLREYNEEQLSHGGSAASWMEYLRTGEFGEGVFENWESEFFQMFSYVVLTAFLVQKGSPESKSTRKGEEVDEDPLEHRKDASAPRIVRYGSPIAVKLYSHSLGIAFFVLWAFTAVVHAWTGSHAFNAEQVEHGGETVSLFGYFATSRFWYESMQNYQSEFMVLGVLLVLGVFLRERHSPESKPVHAPHGT